jgi:hypothetical protein
MGPIPSCEQLGTHSGRRDLPFHMQEGQGVHPWGNTSHGKLRFMQTQQTWNSMKNTNKPRKMTYQYQQIMLTIDHSDFEVSLYVWAQLVPYEGGAVIISLSLSGETGGLKRLIALLGKGRVKI